MSAEMEKKKVAEKVWLDYFNEYLFEHGLIDEMTRNKLRIKIITMEKKSQYIYRNSRNNTGWTGCFHGNSPIEIAESIQYIIK